MRITGRKIPWIDPVRPSTTTKKTADTSYRHPTFMFTFDITLVGDVGFPSSFQVYPTSNVQQYLARSAENNPTYNNVASLRHHLPIPWYGPSDCPCSS
jgi:hypothetical protein